MNAQHMPSTVRWMFLLLLLLPLLFLTLQVKGVVGHFGKDAAYYLQIAINVAEGRGFVSNVSLYFEGLHLPAKATIYPVWPLLLGYAGRCMDIFKAATVLPRIFYFADLVLLYVLSRQVVERMKTPLSPRARLVFPYLLVALLGTNYVFFWATSQPYTEGLAFLFAITAFLALARAVPAGEAITAPKTPWLIASALFCALAFLTRSQLICVVAGIGTSLAFGALRQPAMRRGVVWFGLCFLAPVLAWVLHNGAIPGLGSLDPLAPTPLKPMVHFVTTDSWASFVWDRLGGLREAFYPWSEFSFVDLFGPAALLVPIALLIIADTSFHKRSWKPVPNLLISALAWVSAIFFISLLMFHGIYYMPWLFGWRHGLPLVFALLVSAPYVWAAGHVLGRLLVPLALCASLILGLQQITEQVARIQGFPLTVAEQELIDWLKARHPSPTLMSTDAQVLAVYSGKNIHWTLCEEPSERTSEMLKRLPIDYVVVPKSDLACPYLHRIDLDLVLSETFGSSTSQPIYLYTRRH